MFLLCLPSSRFLKVKQTLVQRMSSENADSQSYAVLRFWFICKEEASP